MVLVFCATLEWLQAWIYHNPFEWTDLFVDSIAIAISPFLLYLLPSRDREGVVSK